MTDDPGGLLWPHARVGAVGLYLTGEDYLQLNVANAAASVVVLVTGRFLPAGADRINVFDRGYVPATDRSETGTILSTGEGWLLDVRVGVSAGTPLYGQTYATLNLNRGAGSSGQTFTRLAAGYITRRHALRWPFGENQAPLDGPGALRSITGTTPAAGAEITETVPTGARWEVLALYATLTTSAVAGSRSPALNFDDGTNVFMRSAATAGQAASTTQRRSWFHSATSLTIDANSSFTIPLMYNGFLAAGYRIRTSTAALDAGDQYSLVQYLVKEWLEG